MTKGRRDAGADDAILQRYREAMGEIAGLLSKATDLANKLAEEDRG